MPAFFGDLRLRDLSLLGGCKCNVVALYLSEEHDGLHVSLVIGGEEAKLAGVPQHPAPAQSCSAAQSRMQR